MHTPKARTGSLEVPQRTSPSTPRTARQLKTPRSDSELVTSPNPSGGRAKERSPKVSERKSPRSPASEKKCPLRVSELESQLAQLQEELKQAKDWLSSSESEKRQAQLESEETKKQLAATSVKLEDLQKQLLELSDSEEARVQELYKNSQDRDRAWQSELEAVQKQHSMDSAALASAMNEIQKLKMQLEKVTESEAAEAGHAASAYAEIQNLRLELMESLALAEQLKTQLNDSKESEAQALGEVSRTQMQLEMAKITEENFRSEGFKAMEAYKTLASDLEQANSQVKSLEGLIGKLQGDLSISNNTNPTKSLDNSKIAQGDDDKEAGQLIANVNQLKLEVGQLRCALEAAEKRYQEEHIKSTLQIRTAYELVESMNLESCQLESELEANLRMAQTDIEELKTRLVDKETKLQSISEENKGLNLKVEQRCSTERESELEMEVKKSEAVLADLKACLLDKEREMQNITEENEMLKSEIKKREMERTKVNDEALALVEAAKAAEREALMKLGHCTEVADKNSRKAARVAEQLDAAQSANSELEAELRRLKVQSDQWRKAAEAAAAILSGNNGKYVERTGSLDYHSIGGKLGSPFSDDIDDNSAKKKSGNMLQKIGVLLKKGHK